MVVYKEMIQGRFLRRPNRFIAHVETEGREEVAHVPNTGRCRELLTEGAEVWLQVAGNPGRKTRLSLVTVRKGHMLVNMDSQVPNAVVAEALLAGEIRELTGVTAVKREAVFGDSRFDIAFGGEGFRGWMEVKGVTLESDGVAMFPDAPTGRGTRHIHEMIRAVESGCTGVIFFLIQMRGVREFRPFEARDPAFATALRAAAVQGVRILAYDAVVTENSIALGEPVPVILD